MRRYNLLIGAAFPSACVESALVRVFGVRLFVSFLWILDKIHGSPFARQKERHRRGGGSLQGPPPTDCFASSVQD